MKKILVPTDFSPNAVRAIDYAVQIAKLNQATIHIIHACDHLYALDIGYVLSKEDYNKKITDEAFNKLEIIKKSIEETEKVLVNTQLYSGAVNDTILVAAQEHNADLIIMGTLGISGIKDKIFGSQTAAIIGNSEVPILAIPLEYDWSPPSKFLLAINYFDEVSEVLYPAFDLAKAFNAEVRLTVFTDEGSIAVSDYLEDAREINFAEEKLRKKYSDIVIKTEHLSGRHFEESINEYIDSNQIDLLVMTTHKRSFIESIFNRSITRKMSYHSKVPILAIPVK
jgi:nucleotide-binding universal stress UspA family protein